NNAQNDGHLVIETFCNPYGILKICEACHNEKSEKSDHFIIIFPSPAKVGQLCIQFRLYTSNFKLIEENFVDAHVSPLVCLAVSKDHKYLATASETGTLIRVFVLKFDDKHNKFGLKCDSGHGFGEKKFEFRS